MIIDAHNHIGIKKGVTFLAEDLIAKMDAAGIDKAVVCSFPEQIDNTYVAKSVQAFPHRFIGFAVVNPWQSDAEEQLLYAITELKLTGVKLHPLRHGYMANNLEILKGILQICQQFQLPILAYAGASNFTIPNMYEELAQLYPDITFIMAHGGQMYETKSAVAAAKRNKNLYIETSGMFKHRLDSAFEAGLASQLLFGTDSPYGDFELEKEKILLAAPKEVQDDIFSGNLQRLLNKGGHEV